MLVVCRNRKCVYYSFLCNLLTNPLAQLLLLAWVFALEAFGTPKPASVFAYYGFVAVIEIAVICAEAFVYKRLGFPARRALLLSALLNALSYGAGLIAFRFPPF